jgi:maltose alpha-D-glucosyltransferase/alpha-amylase
LARALEGTRCTRVSERWYQEAVIYSVQIESFQDSDGDGFGDLPGLISRLDYLSRLGVTCLWLCPIYPSPRRDNGYDVSDYYGVDLRLGTLGDFAQLATEARERGIRLMLDLVVNHTSDQHPWFQSARSDSDSPYRDWYIWSSEEPPDRQQGIVFPGEQAETWTFDDVAKQWYYHRFYDFQPDLNWANPAVRSEIDRVMGFWLQLGASGFRVDAAPFVLEMTQPGVAQPPIEWSILDNWRQELQWQRGDAVLLCEANVDPGSIVKYTTSTPDGSNDRAHMMFDFLLNARLWLALARRTAEPLIDALLTAPRLPQRAQWASFLRNHDELDLSRLTDKQRADVFRALAPRPDMHLYQRGVRRRLAPMLRGDQRHIRLAYALQFSMPGTPVLRYGEEIGMGEDLSLPGREGIRTPMQWDDRPNGGFSTAPADRLVRPTTRGGKYGWHAVNVRAQERTAGSLFRWFEQMIHTLRECPEIGVGECTVLEPGLPPSVLAHRCDAPEGSVLLLHNLDDVAVTADIGPLTGTDRPFDMFADTEYPTPSRRLTGLQLSGWGYRWIRLARAVGD